MITCARHIRFSDKCPDCAAAMAGEAQRTKEWWEMHERWAAEHRAKTPDVKREEADS